MNNFYSIAFTLACLLLSSIGQFVYAGPSAGNCAFSLDDNTGDCNTGQTPVSFSEVLDYAENHNNIVLGAERYYTLIKASIAKATASAAREVAQADLTLAEEHFNNGEANNFQVIKAQSALLSAEENLLDATRAWVLSSAGISNLFKESPEKLYRPTDLDLEQVPGFVAPALQANVDLTVFEDVYKLAKKRHRGVPNYQLEHKLVQAHTDWRFKKDLLEKSREQLTLAQTNLRQMTVSFETGMSSRHDVLMARLFFLKSQYQLVDATAGFDLARLRLLEATGTLDDTLDDWLKTQPKK